MSLEEKGSLSQMRLDNKLVQRGSSELKLATKIGY